MWLMDAWMAVVLGSISFLWLACLRFDFKVTAAITALVAVWFAVLRLTQ